MGALRKVNTACDSEREFLPDNLVDDPTGAPAEGVERWREASGGLGAGHGVPRAVSRGERSEAERLAETAENAAAVSYAWKRGRVVAAER